MAGVCFFLPFATAALKRNAKVFYLQLKKTVAFYSAMRVANGRRKKQTPASKF